MVKRGMLNVKASNKGDWKLRWVVLQGTTLGIFASRQKNDPMKVLNVQGGDCSVYKEMKRPFGMMLRVKGEQDYLFAAESEMDRDDWMERIKDVGEHGDSSRYLSKNGRSSPRESKSANSRMSLPLSKSPRESKSSPPKDAVKALPPAYKLTEEEERMYEKHKKRLTNAGFGQDEFRRNSRIILNVLDFEESLERSNEKHRESVKLAEEMEEMDLELDSVEEKPSSAVPQRMNDNNAVARSVSSPQVVAPSQVHKKPMTTRSQNFVDRRDSMKFDKQHKTLNELCARTDPTSKYKKMTKIGEGSFGTVYAAVDKYTKNRVAIKKMAVTRKNKAHLEMELELHKACSEHPNVVPVIESYLLQDARKWEVWVVLQFLEYGSLTETLTQLHMKEPEIAYVCKEVVSALSWLHSQNTVHR